MGCEIDAHIAPLNSTASAEVSALEHACSGRLQLKVCETDDLSHTERDCRLVCVLDAHSLFLERCQHWSAAAA